MVTRPGFPLPSDLQKIKTAKQKNSNPLNQTCKTSKELMHFPVPSGAFLSRPSVRASVRAV
jgi:hypothetical protein